MKLRAPGEMVLFKLRYALWMIVLLAVIIFGAYWFHFRSSGKLQNPDYVPSDKVFSLAESQQAASAANSKDYETAINLYLMSAHEARLSNEPNQAVAILQQAVTKIPDANITWEVYSALADNAKVAGNKTVEKQALTKAIQKAGAAGSDVLPDQLTAMQKRLSGL